MAMHVGEAAFDAIVVEGESCVMSEVKNLLSRMDQETRRTSLVAWRPSRADHFTGVMSNVNSLRPFDTTSARKGDSPGRPKCTGVTCT